MDNKLIDNRVGENLKRLRKRKGISQKALAEEAGIARASVSYAETGTHLPSAGTLKELARVLEVPVETFYERPEDIASLLRLNKILTDDVMRAREEGDENRLTEYLYPELDRVTRLLNRFGPFTEAPASKKRRTRQQAQEAPVDKSQAETG
jgi:transcriptional regulator with XRE-family HTH domain